VGGVRWWRWWGRRPHESWNTSRHIYDNHRRNVRVTSTLDDHRPCRPVIGEAFRDSASKVDAVKASTTRRSEGEGVRGPGELVRETLCSITGSTDPPRVV